MQTVSWAGQSYNIPNQRGDTPWSGLSDFAIAVAAKGINVNGGNFTLLADLNFGASFGIISTYFKSRTASIATAGQIRLAVSDLIEWRNTANGGNLTLGVNGSDRLVYGGAAVLTAGTGLIVNADISASAAIAFSKMAALTTSKALVSDSSGIVVPSTVTTTELQAIHSLTASRALVTDGSGLVTPATTTATEIGYVNGVTSAIQTQINGKQATGNYITALTGGVTATGPGSVTATVVTNANLTGPITSSGNATSIASQTGTGTKFVVDTSPTLVTPNVGAATAASLTFSPTTSGIVGTTTNDSASAGKVGEYSAVNSPTGGTATPGSTDAFVNITSISLTAGDWDVWGTARLDTGGTWAGTRFDIGVSLSSAAADSTSLGGYIRQQYTIPASSINLFSTGARRISLSGTATVYLVGSLTYVTLGATTWSSNSILMARRVR